MSILGWIDTESLGGLIRANVVGESIKPSDIDRDRTEALSHVVG
jgi:hypothetical protein